MSLEEFNENYLNVLLEKISKEDKSFFLLGDFNVDLLKYDKHNSTNEFLDSLSSNFFLPNIVLPTRINGNSKTLIDNIFSNITSSDTVSGNVSASISDHLPQFCIVPELLGGSTTNKTNIYERDWSKFDRPNFILDYLAVDWTSKLKLNDKNIDYSFNIFLDNTTTLLDKHAPLKKISKYKLKFRNKPWITKAIQKSINVKNNYFTRYIKARNPEIKAFYQDKYKRYRNSLSTLLKASKTKYYEEYFSKNMKDIKNTWKGINSIISKTKKNLYCPKSITDNNIQITDPKAIANSFNDYFCNVANGIQSSIKFSLRTFDYFLKDYNAKSFFISPTNQMEVSDTIKTLDISKSEGPNGIPSKILHMLVKDISPLLADLFNLSFSAGAFPSTLKTAKIIPIHKKLSKENCSNYRPISILSNIDKILERLMYNRLYKFLESNNIIYHLQFGFRKNFSTTLALLDITDNIKQEIDKGNFGCGIFIDFQKAFDTVDHTILLKKLLHYGIRGTAQQWFQSYLTGRNQYVSINGFNSDLLETKCGVPQGSVLGPLLFLLYINDLYSSIRFSRVHHFADDTNLLYFSNSIKQINKYVNIDLKNLVHWLNANKIALNVSKTELVVFKPNRKKLDYEIKLKLKGCKIYPTASVRYLGVKIDAKLNWKDQHNDVSIKLIRANAILSKLRHFVNNETLKMIYHSVFESHFKYANIVWGQTIDSSHRLFLLQKKALRIIFFQNRLSHTNPLFLSSSIIKLYDQISIDNCIFINKVFNKRVPPIFQDWFAFSSLGHSHNLRSCASGFLKIPHFNTKYHGRLSFRINAIYTWNNLQKQLKPHLFFKLNSNKLKSILSRYFLQSYS